MVSILFSFKWYFLECMDSKNLIEQVCCDSKCSIYVEFIGFCQEDVILAPQKELSLHYHLYKDDLRDGNVGRIAAASASSESWLIS